MVTERGRAFGTVAVMMFGGVLIAAPVASEQVSQPPSLTGLVSSDWSSLFGVDSGNRSSLGWHLQMRFQPREHRAWRFDANVRDRESVSGGGRAYRSIYDAKVTYAPGRLAIVAGRMSIYDVASAGTIDGGRLDYTLDSIAVGGFAGFMPEIGAAGFSTADVSFGGHASFFASGGSRSDIAVIETRHEGRTERRWLSAQNFLYFGPGTTIYQVLEYELGGGIPGSNRLSRFLASGSAVLSDAVSVSGSFSFGRAIDFRRILMEAPDSGIITDPSILGALYHQNANMSLRWRIGRSMRVRTGLTLFKRSSTDTIVKQIRAGLGGVQIAGFSFDASYARSFEASGAHGVFDFAASRSLGPLSVDFTYASYGDAVSISGVGVAPVLTPVPGYKIVGVSAAARVAGDLSIVADLQRAMGESADYTTIFVRAMYRIR